MDTQETAVPSFLSFIKCTSCGKVAGHCSLPSRTHT
jgi:hypothetical protein